MEKGNVKFIFEFIGTLTLIAVGVFALKILSLAL